MSTIISTQPVATEIDNPPKPELADIFRRYAVAYRAQYPTSQQQRLVMRDIIECRTAALGGHVDECDNCGGLRIAYNSCRNRHCPKCGGLAKAMWLEKQQALLLPVPYFHVVFTIDHALNPVVRVNQKLVYDLLFRTAAATLKAFGQRYLGGEIGLTAVLHTWGQTLTEHIHLHCVVTGGALSANEQRWRAAKPTFLFPIEAVSVEFRDTFCNGLTQLYQKGQLTFAGESEAFAAPTQWQALLASTAAKKWQVYAKPPFGGAAQVLDYLGRYVHRIAIGNQRLLSLEQGVVRFTYRDYKQDGQQQVMELSALEFMRRFLQHVLPKGFVRVRHYGLLAPRYRQQKLARCRQLLGTILTKVRSQAEVLTEMLGQEPDKCPLCQQGQFQALDTIDPPITRRNWVLAVG